MKKQNKPFEKLRLAVLFSGSASGLRYLMENDDWYGNAYELVTCLTNKKDASALLHPVIGDTALTHVHDYSEWCTKNFYSKGDMEGRERYCAELIEYLRLEKPDVILLSGFMLKLTPNFVAAFKNRIINVHPANLRIPGPGDKPLYRGDNAVRDAMDNGERETASTVHFVTDEVDCGEIIYISSSLPVIDGISPAEQQEKMKTACDGPAIQNALRLLIEGIFTLGENQQASEPQTIRGKTTMVNAFFGPLL